MTKYVRIENADTSNFKVIVEVWDKPYTDPTTGEVMPARLDKIIRLDYPTAMLNEYLTSSRYFIVKEE